MTSLGVLVWFAVVLVMGALFALPLWMIFEAAGWTSETSIFIAGLVGGAIGALVTMLAIGKGLRSAGGG